MFDRTGLQNAVAAAPHDSAPKLVYADWLDEHGEPVLAAAYRWAGERGLHPFQRHARKSPEGWGWDEGELVWDWDREGKMVDVPDTCRLPISVWRAIMRLPDRVYGTVDDAFMLLGRALAAEEQQETH